MVRSPDVESPRELLERDRKFLWGLCYRMTGSASDAEDLVQETFVRALEKPPADTNAAWRPWLVRVAMNLSKDQLRKRKRRSYHGPWLPSPLENADELIETAKADAAESPEARYGLMESTSYAFMVALEQLTATQRAVLVLRDALDYSSRETAEFLGLSEENVRITLHRARKAMERYDTDRPPSGRAHSERVMSVIGQIMACFATNDIEGFCALVSTDVRYLADGGGVYHAGKRAIQGGERIGRMYMKLASRASDALQVEVRDVNGQPVVAVTDPAPRSPNAPRALLIVDVGGSGKVRALYSVLAPEKLGRVRFEALPPSADTTRRTARSRASRFAPP